MRTTWPFLLHIQAELILFSNLEYTPFRELSQAYSVKKGASCEAARRAASTCLGRERAAAAKTNANFGLETTPPDTALRNINDLVEHRAPPPGSRIGPGGVRRAQIIRPASP